MKQTILAILHAALLLAPLASLHAADEPVKPVLKITPGQVIVPTDAMRRIGGELVSVDLKTRTGTFRKEGTNEIISFTMLPYAALENLLSAEENLDILDRVGSPAVQNNAFDAGASPDNQ